MTDWHCKENRKRKTFPLDDYLAGKLSHGSFDKKPRGEKQSSGFRSGHSNNGSAFDHYPRSARNSLKVHRPPSAEDISDSEFPDYLTTSGSSRTKDHHFSERKESLSCNKSPEFGNFSRNHVSRSHSSPIRRESPRGNGNPSRIVVMSSSDLLTLKASHQPSRRVQHERDEWSPEDGEYFDSRPLHSRAYPSHAKSEKYSEKGRIQGFSDDFVGHKKISESSRSRNTRDERNWQESPYHEYSKSTKEEKYDKYGNSRSYNDHTSKSRSSKNTSSEGLPRLTNSRYDREDRERPYSSRKPGPHNEELKKIERSYSRREIERDRSNDIPLDRERTSESWKSLNRTSNYRRSAHQESVHTKDQEERSHGKRISDKRSHHSARDAERKSELSYSNISRHQDEYRSPGTPNRNTFSDRRKSYETESKIARRERAKVEFNYHMWTKGGELNPNHHQNSKQSTIDFILPDSTSGPSLVDETSNFDDFYAVNDGSGTGSNYLPSYGKVKDENKREFTINYHVQETPANKVELHKPLTVQALRYNCRVQCLDRKFLSHLSEMHPTSALHELCTRLEWSPPELSLAFEFGPPAGKMYIFKAVVNGQTYQPAIAVENKKDAKANCAWFALQEMGFVKKDISNPL